MTMLGRRDVEQLIGWDQKKVKDWLLVGLDTWRHGSEGYNPRSAYAFPGAERAILGDGDITDMLAAIDGALDERSRVAFAAGCAAALASLRPDAVPRHAQLAEDLILLGSKLGTRDLLPVLADIALAAGTHAPGRSRLLEYALRHFAAAGSSSPRLGDTAMLRRVIGNYQAIPPRHAITALLALLKVAPTRLIKHLDMLAEPFEVELGLRRDEPDAAEEERAKRRADLILFVARDERTRRAMRHSYMVGSLRHADGMDDIFLKQHWWTLTLRVGLAEGLPALRRKLGLTKPEEPRDVLQPPPPELPPPPGVSPISETERQSRRAEASSLLDGHLRSYDDAEMQGAS